MQYTEDGPKLNDFSLMPWGKAHKGTPMANVPASYLLWAERECRLPKNLKTYIDENRDALEIEAKRMGKFISR